MPANSFWSAASPPFAAASRSSGSSSSRDDTTASQFFFLLAPAGLEGPASAELGPAVAPAPACELEPFKGAERGGDVGRRAVNGLGRDARGVSGGGGDAYCRAVFRSTGDVANSAGHVIPGWSLGSLSSIWGWASVCGHAEIQKLPDWARRGNRAGEGITSEKSIMGTVRWKQNAGRWSRSGLFRHEGCSTGWNI